ncbi:hypothetical protein KJ633_03530 [bacterium]|nr:hypothetical protein [bacterium]MBU3955509.1 hypothetical protein [bacterium]
MKKTLNSTPRLRNILFFLFLFVSNQFAFFIPSSEDAGSIDGYLRGGIGARHLAMGRTGVSYPSGAEAMYWNPAALAGMSSFEGMLSYNMLFADTYEFFAGEIIPTQWWGNFGVGILRLGVRDVEGWNAQNLSTGKIENENSAYFISYGNSGYASPLELGATLKIAHHNVAGYTDKGFGFDFGARYTFFSRSISVGAVYRNLLGPSIRLISEEERYPPSFALGVSGHAGDFFLSSDGTLSSGENIKLAMGAEYRRYAPFFFRFGLNDTEISSGFGYEFKAWKLNYAYALHSAWSENLGSSHRIDLSRSFSGNLQKFKAGANKEITRAFKKSRRFARKGKLFYAVDAARKTLELDNQHEDAAGLIRRLYTESKEGIDSGKITKFEDVSYARGIIAYIDNDMPVTLNYLKQNLNLEPSNNEVRDTINQINAAILKKRMEDEARDKFQKIDQYMNDGIYLYSTEDYATAAEKFKLLLQLDPDNKDAARYLELCRIAIQELMDKNKPKPAPVAAPRKEQPKEEKKPEKKFEVDIEKAEALYTDGLVEYSLGRIKNAIYYWQMAIKYDPNNRKIKKAIINAEKKIK